MPNDTAIDPRARSFFTDQQVAARVLAHIEHGTTDVGDRVWREPVANYRCPERFERERVEVLRRWPIPYCPSASLSRPGAYVAREAAGTPLIAVRGNDGRVRAFRNACRHRGAQLVDGAGSTPSLVCPYHGWTYRLDGTLHRIPHAGGFPGVDPCDHGLSEVACEERLGLVFVTQDAPANAALGALDALPELLAPEQQLLASDTTDLDGNWKVHLEGFIEGYHIRATHPESFYPYGFDNLNIVETVGPNSRVTYPFRRIAKLADVPAAQRRVEGLLTYVYHLFPNALVTVLSRHTNLVVLEPLAVDRTRFVLYSLANRGEGDDPSQAVRDAAFVNQSGAAEDRAVVQAIHRSLGSGANDAFTFGRFEAAIAHFHGRLHGLLGGGHGSN